MTLFLLLLGQAHITVFDGESMLAVAQSVVHDGSLSVEPRLGVAGDDGDYYSKYGLLLPLLSLVPVALVQPIGLVTGKLHLLEAAAASSLIPLFTGALAAALFLLGRRLGAPRTAAAVVAVGIVLGTYLLPYGRDFFSEPLTALGIVVMLERALAGRAVHAGAALGFAMLARPQSAVFVPLLWGFLALRGGGVRAIASTLPPLAVAAAITVAYNLARFGEPLEFGYDPPVDPGFTTPFFEGTAGLLFSPEKSIFLFAPVIVLAPAAILLMWRRDRATTALLVTIFVATFGLAATWHSWEGGWSWGPRLLIPGVAVLLVALGPWIGANAKRLRVAGALFAVGFLVSIAAVIAPSGAQFIDRPSGTDGPEIVRQVTELPGLTERSVEAIDDRGAPDDYRRYLALWQVGISREVGWAGVLLALLGTTVLAVALVRVGRPLVSRA